MDQGTLLVLDSHNSCFLLSGKHAYFKYSSLSKTGPGASSFWTCVLPTELLRHENTGVPTLLFSAMGYFLGYF